MLSESLPEGVCCLARREGNTSCFPTIPAVPACACRPRLGLAGDPEGWSRTCLMEHSSSVPSRSGLCAKARPWLECFSVLVLPMLGFNGVLTVCKYWNKCHYFDMLSCRSKLCNLWKKKFPRGLVNWSHQRNKIEYIYFFLQFHK